MGPSNLYNRFTVPPPISRNEMSLGVICGRSPIDCCGLRHPEEKVWVWLTSSSRALSIPINVLPLQDREI